MLIFNCRENFWWNLNVIKLRGTDTKGISTWCICQNTKPIWKICPWSNFPSKFEIQQIISLCGCLRGLTGWSLVGRRQDIKCRCDTRLCGIFVKISTFRYQVDTFVVLLGGTSRVAKCQLLNGSKYLKQTLTKKNAWIATKCLTLPLTCFDWKAFLIFWTKHCLCWEYKQIYD